MTTKLASISNANPSKYKFILGERSSFASMPLHLKMYSKLRVIYVTQAINLPLEEVEIENHSTW